MKKKLTGKLMGLLIILLFLSTFSIGFATWVFTIDHPINGDYEPQIDVNINNMHNQSISYNGEAQEPKFPLELQEIKNNFYDVVDITKDGTSFNGAMVDAGDYVVRYSSTDKEYLDKDIVINFTILPYALELNYYLDLYSNESFQKSELYTSNINIEVEPNKNNYYLPNVKIKSKLFGNDQCNVSLYRDEQLSSKIDFSIKTNRILINGVQHNYYIGIDNSNYLLKDNNFKVKISKLVPHLILKSDAQNTVFGINYSENYRTYDAFKTNLEAYLTTQIYYASGQKFDYKDQFLFNVNYMHDGKYLYGNTNEDLGFTPIKYDKNKNSSVNGSTYLVNVSISNNDYALDTQTIYVKYKTCNIGTNKNEFYTIEDALLKKGDIVLVGNDKDKNSYVATTFTSLDFYNKTNLYSLSANRTLSVPYNKYNVNKTGELKEGLGNNNIFSAFIIPEHVTLEIDGASLNVCGMIGSSGENCGKTGQRGVLQNDGIIKLKNNANLVGYGFIKGDNKIINSNGKQKEVGIIESINSSLFDVFRLYDFKGGSMSAAHYVASVFPAQVYSFHNISCKISIDNNSRFYARYRIATSAGNGDADVLLLGKDSNNKGLFSVKNSNDKIYKSCIDYDSSWNETNNLNKDIKSTNQDANQKDVITIKGTFIDNKVSLTMAGQNIQTSKDFPLPIGFMRIHLLPETNGLLSNSSFAFLPGCELIIDKGATIDINNISVEAYGDDYETKYQPVHNPDTHESWKYTYYHKEYFARKTGIGAKIINNGTMVISGSADGFGGVIETTEAGSNIVVDNAFGQINRATTIDVDKKYLIPFISPNPVHTGKVKHDLNIMLKDGNSIGYGIPIAKQFYTSVKDNNGVVYYQPNNNVNKVTINFKDDDGTLLESKVKYIQTDSYTVTGLEYIPSKVYDDFVEWTYPGGTNVVNKGGTIDLIAKYTPHIFRIDYRYVYDNNYQSIDENIIAGHPGIWEVKYDKTTNKLSYNKGDGVWIDNLDSIPLPDTNNIVSNLSNNSINGWFVGNLAVHSDKTIKSLSVNAFKRYTEKFGQVDFYLYQQYYDFVVNIDYGNNIIDSFYMSNNQKLKDLNFVLNDSIVTKNNDNSNPTYIDEFKYNDEYIHFNDISNYVFKYDPNVSNVINLTLGLSKQKLKISSKIVDSNYNINYEIWKNGNNEPIQIYLMPGQTLGKNNYDLIVDKQKDIENNSEVKAYTDGFVYANNQKIDLSENTTFDKDTIITFKYNKKTVITITCNLTINIHTNTILYTSTNEQILEYKDTNTKTIYIVPNTSITVKGVHTRITGQKDSMITCGSNSARGSLVIKVLNENLTVSINKD